MNHKKLLISAVLILSLLALLAGCNESGTLNDKSMSLKSQLVGSWYKDGKTSVNRDGGRGPAFTLFDNGTCEIATEYGTGRWSVVNENQLQLTNFYGETEVATIESVENGCLTLENGAVFWNSLQ